MRRRRYPWLLGACVTASAALHALVFSLLPLARQAGDLSHVSVLDVVLVEASAPPATPLEPVTRGPAARVEPPRPQPEVQRRVPPADAIPPPAHVSLPAVPQRDESLAVAESSGANPLSAAETTPAPAVVAAPPPQPQSVTPPVFHATYLRNPAPRYPLTARRNGEHGTVTLKVLVTREGAAAQVRLEHSSGSPHLDRAASAAVKNWRFVPARQGTQAVEAWVLVPVVFRLEG